MWVCVCVGGGECVWGGMSVCVCVCGYLLCLKYPLCLLFCCFIFSVMVVHFFKPMSTLRCHHSYLGTSKNNVTFSIRVYT